ncbi:hypothetical protein [Nocardia carnea]|uniref:hypothetical protein n=1 Tax=Nocardia carnea TaxID=37328 RepID=UPI002455D1E4|nr:hypothetical protein [Nocardia carnea]
MSADQLREWAGNFASLQTELRNYDRTAAEVHAKFPGRPGPRGPGQLIAFQLPHLLSMLGFQFPGIPPAWLSDISEVDPQRNPQHVLMGRYFVEMISLQAEDGSRSLDQVRDTLLETAGRMQGLAGKWAASGVDAEELATVVEEAKVLAEKVRRAAEGSA